MRHLFLVFYALATIAAGLRAHEQTHVHESEENPSSPSKLFLQALEHRKTLVLFDDEDQARRWSGFLNHLRGDGHEVTVVTNQMAQFHSRGRWLYDSVVVVGNNSLPRVADDGENIKGRLLLDWFDEHWLLPDAHGANPIPGLVLPPSLMVFASGCTPSESVSCSSPETCRPSKTLRLLAKQFGINVAETSETVSTKCLNQPLWNGLEDSFVTQLKFTGTSHQSNPDDIRTVTALGKAGDSDFDAKAPAVITRMQGVRNWNRLVWSSSEDVCESLGADMPTGQKKFCLDLLDWAFHKRDVTTWANWQQLRVGGEKTWTEYEGKVQKKDWSLNDLKSLNLEVYPPQYRIRDEIIEAVDFYDLQRNSKRGFTWVPRKDKAYGHMTYHMMVPYNRELLVPVNSLQQPTPLLAALKNKYTLLKETLPLKMNDATHWTHFKTCTQHGIFKSVVKSLSSADTATGKTLEGKQTRGQTNKQIETPLHIESIMPLRTYKHDEDPRFVPQDYTYYGLTILSTIVFSFVYITVLLLHKITPHAKTN